MNKFLAILGLIGAVLGLVISFLPISNLAIFPAIIGFILGLIVFLSTKKKNTNISFPRIILILSLLAIIISVGKQLIFEDKVVEDTEFIEKTKQSEKDAVKDLEKLEQELDEDLEELE